MRAGHAAIGAIAAAGFVADFTFFPAAGWLVDQRGRKVSAASAPATATTATTARLLLRLFSPFPATIVT